VFSSPAWLIAGLRHWTCGGAANCLASHAVSPLDTDRPHSPTVALTSTLRHSRPVVVGCRSRGQRPESMAVKFSSQTSLDALVMPSKYVCRQLQHPPSSVTVRAFSFSLPFQAACFPTNMVIWSQALVAAFAGSSQLHATGLSRLKSDHPVASPLAGVQPCRYLAPLVNTRQICGCPGIVTVRGVALGNCSCAALSGPLHLQRDGRKIGSIVKAHEEQLRSFQKAYTGIC
jgi:hypothetical protein